MFIIGYKDIHDWLKGCSRLNKNNLEIIFGSIINVLVEDKNVHDWIKNNLEIIFGSIMNVL